MGTGRGLYWGMASPSANQNRPPRPGAYRYCACVSSAWLVLRATEVAHTNTAVPVLPEAIPDKESPAGEWARSFAGSAVSTNNASNALRTHHLNDGQHFGRHL